jgi:hypothetical protein
MPSSSVPETERLLAVYRFWGLATVAFFALFILSMVTAVTSTGLNHIMIAVPLLFGFLWIGTTSLSRHSLILLKQCIGRKVGLLEFVSTQFVFILFPFTYKELKKEVALHEGLCK